MKMKKLILAGSLAACMAVSGYAQTVINFTGATAFRAASHNAIRTMFENNGGVEYAYTGHQDLSGANRAIFSGTIGGVDYIVRTSWSGSGAGIQALANNEAVQVLVLGTPRDATGINVEAPDFETDTASFAFSDVEQTATTTPDAGLIGRPVGVVPFMFVANRAAPETFTDLTNQLMQNLYTAGFAPLSMFTGVAADIDQFVYATGRASSSGTRITILAETGFGISNAVSHVEIAAGSGPITGDDIGAFPAGPNGGYSSNSFIRDVVQRDSDGFVVVSYLTISDALVATAPADGDAGGARALTYNGIEYSEENVKTGKYTLWGYQQLYQKQGALSAEEQAFLSLLETTIPSTLGSAGIPIPEMLVQRIGGDGGQIVPVQ